MVVAGREQQPPTGIGADGHRHRHHGWGRNVLRTCAVPVGSAHLDAIADAGPVERGGGSHLAAVDDQSPWRGIGGEGLAEVGHGGLGVVDLYDDISGAGTRQVA